MPKLVSLAAAAAVLAAGSLTGCAAFSDSATTSDDGKLTVVAAFYPLQFVAQRVAGDRVSVGDLTRPGQEPHDLELSPKQTGDVAAADLVVYEKGLQASVDAAVGQSAAKTVDAADVAGLEPMSHGGHDDVDHSGAGETADEEAEEAHDHGDLDPHFWQDPLKLARVADAVADRLASLDPANASTYRSNAEALDTELTRLDQEFSAGLSHCERDTIVVSHNAFGYLGRYGLYVEPIAGLSPDAEPTPADLGRLHQLITSEGITTVFGERLVPAELSRTLAKDMGITTVVLDPIEGLTDETADEDYLSLMRANLKALEEANGCQ
ncbi:zinc transport system substrate-binding protein [Nocardioides terrae]|uniref:Zinc transport system substrate-binding protein n=1 Tax=Nocardioides terrae TaxID=574651 RepID=A0A1I1D4X3_9ACTN|nr:metal ABC transporter substrate-binding protein [Nocardioides terrae]SFB69864.1 zinc transport system substrate-binding protein [Nocardioides terrae]